MNKETINIDGLELQPEEGNTLTEEQIKVPLREKLEKELRKTLKVFMIAYNTPEEKQQLVIENTVRKAFKGGLNTVAGCIFKLRSDITSAGFEDLLSSEND